MSLADHQEKVWAYQQLRLLPKPVKQAAADSVPSPTRWSWWAWAKSLLGW